MLYKNIPLAKSTENDTIINYAIRYTNKMKVLYNINEVRRYKGVFFPCELVSPSGKSISDCYVNEKEESCIL